jgi:hypothetical protein
MSSDWLDKDIIYVNSIEKTSGLSNEFTINLTNKLRTPNDYDSATLLNFSCPKSYYLINQYNNSLILIEGQNQYQINIPVGNYDFQTMATELTTLFNQSSQFTYSIITNQTTGKYLFSVQNNNLQPSIEFNTELYKIIGFNKEVYNFANNQLYSRNIVNFQLTNTLKLCCNFVEKAILSIIVPNNQDFSFINYNEVNSQLSSHRVLNNNLGSAKFWLLDQDDRLIDLNGLNFNFTFCMFKKNSYYQTMLDFKKIESEIQQIERELGK